MQHDAWSRGRAGDAPVLAAASLTRTRSTRTIREHAVDAERRFGTRSRATVVQPDVVVIGSGPSGASAALALVERGVPVTLLESGVGPSHGVLVRAFGRNVFRRWASPPDQPPAYRSLGDPDTYFHQGLMPGGLSNFWTAAVPRFAPMDFAEGARLDECYRWPIGYADLEPYYARLERLLGVISDTRGVPMLESSRPRRVHRLPADWQQISDVAATMGQGVTPVPLAAGSAWMVRRSGANFNSFNQIVRKLMSHRNFRLMLGAHATSLEWSARRGRVEAVVYRDASSGGEQRLAARAVVVAAGPLLSAKLLLQSKSADFPRGLGNNHGLLGRYLHDHPKDWCVLELDRPLSRLSHTAYVTRVPYAEAPPLHAAAIVLGPASRRDRYLSVLPFGVSRRFGMTTFATIVPSASNYVSLHPTAKDAHGEPILDICLQFDDAVKSTIGQAHARFVSILGEAGYRARIVCDAPRLTPGSAAHFGGTVRMHSSEKYGMLNGWNRLHAVDNVAVVDASSFTTGVEKNPTLTAMALALRAGSGLANDLGYPAVART